MSEADKRKATPVFSGVIKYFPDALKCVAQCSLIANEQHNPGTEMHWDRAKSGDELDALARHLIDAGEIDSDGIRHSAKVAWRALANLQKELERDRENESTSSNSGSDSYAFNGVIYDLTEFTGDREWFNYT